MPASTFIGHFLGPDMHANRPAATGLPNGTLYVCTTHSKIERVVSGAWADYATLGSTYGGVVSDAIFDAKGDLIVATAADMGARLPVGSNNQILAADSTQATGVKWVTPGGTLLLGPGAPVVGLGSLNDLYEDTTTGDLYQKQNVVPSPTFRAASATTDLTGTTVSIPLPASIVAGELLIVALAAWYFTDTSKPNLTGIPAGWTQLGTRLTYNGNNGKGASLIILYKTASGSEGSSLSVTYDLGSHVRAISSAYSGGSFDVGTLAAVTVSGVPDATVPTVTTTQGGDKIVSFMDYMSGTAIPPTGWSVARGLAVSGSGSFGKFVQADVDQVSAGAIATANWTGAINGFSPVGMATIAIKGGSATPTWILVVPWAQRADAKGDLLVATAPDTLSRLAVGTDGQVLTADSAQAAGVKWGASGALIINAQSAASYTLVLTDAGKLVSINNASANTITVPTNGTVAFAIGTTIRVRQAGAGQTSIAGTGGVTVNSRGAALKLAGQYAYATLVKVATDTWELSGDITT